MSAAIQLNECYDEPSGEKLPPHARAGNSNDGGNVDEILKRLDKLESTVSETREQVIEIAAAMPSLATKADIGDVRVEVSELRGEVRSIAATIPHLATKADLSAEIGSVRADLKNEIGSVRADLKSEIGSVRAAISALETSIIKWFIATVIAATGLGVAIEKFVH